MTLNGRYMLACFGDQYIQIASSRQMNTLRKDLQRAIDLQFNDPPMHVQQQSCYKYDFFFLGLNFSTIQTPI